MLIACQECNAQISEAAAACPKCGASPDAFLGAPTSCAECGNADYRPAHAQCRKCGAPKSVATPKASKQAQSIFVADAMDAADASKPMDQSVTSSDRVETPREIYPSILSLPAEAWGLDAVDSGAHWPFVMFRFTGRLNRLGFIAYWLGTSALLLWIIVAGARVPAFVLLLFFAAPLLIFIRLAAVIRRLHDTDNSGWLLFVPFVGAVLAFTWPGTRGQNRFGQSHSEWTLNALRAQLGAVRTAIEDGDASFTRQQADAALAHYRAAFAGLEKFASQDDDADAIGDFVVCSVRVGNARILAGDPNGAAVDFKDALTMLRRLEKKMPGRVTEVASLQRSAWLSIWKNEPYESNSADAEGACDYFRRQFDNYKRLSLAAPYNARLQRDVWLVMWRLAPHAASGGGVTWQQVVSFMEIIKSRRLLTREDDAFLEAARARATYGIAFEARHGDRQVTVPQSSSSGRATDRVNRVHPIGGGSVHWGGSTMRLLLLVVVVLFFWGSLTLQHNASQLGSSVDELADAANLNMLAFYLNIGGWAAAIGFIATLFRKPKPPADPPSQA